jgi:hypothetical protein
MVLLVPSSVSPFDVMKAMWSPPQEAHGIYRAILLYLGTAVHAVGGVTVRPGVNPATRRSG